MTKRIGLYLHIPFCRSKCAYCDFFSGRATEAYFRQYTTQLKNKIEYWGKQANETVSSVYFGGGTPSVLGTDRLCALLSCVKACFTVADNAEITLEVNPESGKSLDFAALRKVGFNRVSIGLQSSDEKELQALGRIHTPDEAALTVRRVHQAGIENTSLDLMLGIPYQTIDSLKKSIDFCYSCGVKHISSYILKIEENTPFYSNREKYNFADDDKQADFYLFTVAYLNSLGYRQYEISNFAVPGYESRHNTLYWQCGEYIGIGPSAHSFYHGKRFFYERNINAFYDGKIIDDGIGGDEEEFIMLSLRLTSGLSYSAYEAKFGKALSPAVKSKIERYARLGLMETDGQSAHFTPRGFLVSNSIISELI